MAKPTTKKTPTVQIRVKTVLEIGSSKVAPGHIEPISMEVEKAKALESAGKLEIVG